MSDMPLDQTVWNFKKQKHDLSQQMADWGTLGITFLCNGYLYHNPAGIYLSDSDYLCIQTFASKWLFHECETKFASYFPAPSSFTTDVPAVPAWMLISSGITFSCVSIIIWWQSRECLFTGAPFYSAADEERTEHNSAGDDWENSKFEWERGDGVTQMCCCSQRAACIRGQARTAMHHHTQSCIHVHRRQHHSIILVTDRSIHCWLTGIQSPFPTGPEWKNSRQRVKKPSRVVDW